MSYFVAAVALLLGAFTLAAPERAAEIWSGAQLPKFTPRRRTVYLRGYRVFGGFLSLSGILLGLNGLFHWY